MKKISLNTFIFIVLSLLLNACIKNLPTTKSSGAAISCQKNEVFNKRTRSCSSTTGDPAPPVPTLSNVNLQEGISQTVFLTYTDSESNLVSSCSAYLNPASLFGNTNPNCSCAAGICSIIITPVADKNINNGGLGDLTYTLTDKDGVSQVKKAIVSIAPVDKAPTITISKTIISLIESQSMLSFKNEVSGGIVVYSGDPELSFTHLNLRTSLTAPYANQINSGGIVVTSTGTDFNISMPASGVFAGSELKFYISNFDGISYSNDILITLKVLKPVNALVSTLNPRIEKIITLPIDNRQTFQSSCAVISDISHQTSNLFVSSPCLCDGVMCSLTVGALNLGMAKLSYFINSNIFPFSLNFQTSSVGSNLAPIIAMSNLEVNEAIGSGIQTIYSSTTGATPFNIPPAFDFEGSILTYSIKPGTNVTQGILSGCLVGASSIVSNCLYTASGPNANSAAVAASSTVGGITLSAKNKSAWGNNLKVEYFKMPLLIPSQPIAFIDYQLTTPKYPILKIFYDSTFTTVDSIVSAINSTPTVNNIFVATGGGTTVFSSGLLSGPQAFVGGVDGLDNFTLQVSDGVNTVESVFSINVLAQNDPPVVCRYATFTEESNCGVKGCIGAGSPANVLAGLTIKNNIYYYDNDPISGGSCYFHDPALGWIPQNPAAPFNHKLIEDKIVNEGDSFVIRNLRVDEGGNDLTENSETLMIKSVTSSNNLLLPLTSITFSWGVPLVGPPASGLALISYPGPGTGELLFNDGTNSGDQNQLNIFISPILGEWGASTISIVFADSSGATTTSTFTVTVNQSTVVHNGWVNIKAVGPKVNSDQVPLENYCNYSTKICGGDDCTGTSSPIGRITGDSQYAIFFDTQHKICYINMSSTTTSDWKPIANSCFQTPSSFDDSLGGSLCLNNRCAGASDPNLIKSSTEGISYAQYSIDPVDANKVNVTCWKNKGLGVWGKYSAPGNVELSWNDFTKIGGGTIDGYNVYRTVAGQPMDYTYPINKILLPHVFGINTYLDNTINSYFPPLPNTVYKYEVKALVNNLNTGTSAVYSKIDVVVPAKNMAFISRRIVNKTMCEKMHLVPNKLKNNRCVYYGPGDTAPNVALGETDSYYDIGSDYIVSRFESGCPYTRTANACSFSTDGICLGILTLAELNSPNNSANKNTIYYSRTEGKCFQNNSVVSGTSWIEITNGALLTPLISAANLPPLVDISKINANSYCAQPQQEFDDNLLLGYTHPAGFVKLPGRLPTRKEQIAMFQYSPSLTDTQINALESGAAMQEFSTKCNTSAANGLELNFVDLDIPPSSIFYSLPGSASSGIRSLATGSLMTTDCQSQFGLQDHVGNVSEFTSDQLTCNIAANTCETMGPGSLTTNVTTPPDPALLSGTTYVLDGNIGPCIDINQDGNCDGLLDSWSIPLQNYNASRYSYPSGLPITTNLNTFTFTSSNVAKYILDIGPSNGILSSALHNDMFKFNLPYVFSSTSLNTNILGGGSYLDGLGAGIHFMSLKPDQINANSYKGNGFLIKSSLVGTHSIITLKKQIVSNAHLEISFSGIDLTANLATDANNGLISTGTDLVFALNGGSTLLGANPTCAVNTIGVDETQELTFSANPDGTTTPISFDLLYGTSKTTVSLSGVSLTPAILQTALDQLKVLDAVNNPNPDPWLQNVTFLASVNGAIPPIYTITFQGIAAGITTGLGRFDHRLLQVSNDSTGQNGSISEKIKGAYPSRCKNFVGYLLDSNANLPLSDLIINLNNETFDRTKDIETGFRCVYPIDSVNYK